MAPSRRSPRRTTGGTGTRRTWTRASAAAARTRPPRRPGATWRRPRTLSSLDAAASLKTPLAALDDARVWLNSAPLTAAGLRGRVVLVDFWTYSCVNWLRTLPYVRAWAGRYGERGLVVVGAHAPEFGFEHELPNVRRAAGELGVEYPIVV